MNEKTFAITFTEAKCGLEILFDPLTNEFLVGQKYHSDTAKKFAAVLPSALIVSLNGTPTNGMSSMDDIQKLFQAAGDGEKVVVFKARLSEDQVAAMNQFEKDSALFVILEDEKVELKAGHYTVNLERRPLGFTIAASPSGEVQIVQVDSVHEEDLKIGSKLISVNGELCKGEREAIKLLMKCRMPAKLVLETVSEENLFAPEVKEDDANWLALSGNSGDMVELSVNWFNKALGKDDYILPINAHATVAAIRAKIAVTSQLKFNAVKLIAKGSLLKDDSQKLSNLNLSKITVVVSQSTQLKEEEKVQVDYNVQMKIMGAFLKSCDKTVLDYLWEDIDYENKGVLHVTELDRLLARFMGLYERATCVHTPIEFQYGTVEFNITETLGLVIEGNEVIMCNPGSQAERQGMLPGWKVVGAEYKDKSKRMVKFPVDHRSCLHSLKRAKIECTDEGFRILCLVPTGEKYETMTIMKKQAIAVLRLDDPETQSTLSRENYDQLPAIFAQKAVRISFLDSLDDSAFSKVPNSENGAIISKEVSNPELTSYAGSTVLNINGQTVAFTPFGDIMKLLFEKRKYHTVTIDMSP